MNALLNRTVFLWLAVCAFAQPVHAGLPAGISGAWYNPAQPGHGISVELLAPDRALLFWYTYDNDGTPMPLYVEGQIQGRVIRGQAYRPSGMRFGSFDPAALNSPLWGELSMEFDDCNNATLRWTTPAPEFGSGSLPFARLTALDGNECSLASRGQVLPQAFEMITRTTITNFGNPQPSIINARGYAALDADGSIWAVETTGDALDFILGPANVSAPQHALIGKALEGAGDIDRLLLRGGRNSWATRPDIHVVAPTIDEDVRSGDGLLLNFSIPDASAIEWQLEPAPFALISPISTQRIARSYVQNLKSQFFNSVADISLRSDRGVCIKIVILGTSLPCDLTGEFWIVDGDTGFFDIELRNQRDLAEGAYRGRGWLQSTANGERLVIAASNGDRVLGIAAQ